MRAVAVLLLGALSFLPAAMADDRDRSESEARYVRDIRPLLQRRCSTCHGPLEQESGLRVDSAAGLLAGGDSGPAIVPGRPDESLILERVSADDESERMPPEGEPLRPDEIAQLREWIEGGAPAPEDEAALASPADHWAFQAPRRPQLPAVGDSVWGRTPADAFVLAQLEQRGFRPSPEAREEVLVRRLYLDLLGLPPTPADIDDYLADPRPDRWERLVDRLLASPAFGERWGRHWLDLARYADTNGMEDDRYRPDAFRYRDFVIDARNADLPYDDFTMEQLAGDLLAAREPPDEDDPPDYRLWAATGFHRMTISNDGGADSKEEEFRVLAVKDRTDTTGLVWMGLTVGCAKCHHHKYDPLSQREYYRLYAFFNACGDATVPAPPLPSRYVEEYERQTEALNGLIASARAELAEYERTELPERLEQWKNDPATPPEDIEVVEAGLQVPVERRASPVQSDLSARIRAFDPQYGLELDGVLRYAGNSRPRPPSSEALAIVERPRSSHVHVRGNFLELGEVVTSGTPGFLPPLVPRGEEADRLDLARWLVSDRHPLTARVEVNRVWRVLFGRGLVEPPDQFGLAGNPPSHPALLDWLACEFVEHDWSHKQLVRTIVTSATYRQDSSVSTESARRDPDNVWLSRQARLRIEAETVRDVALSVSGLLYRQIGGPSFQPPLPDGLLTLDELKSERFMSASPAPDRYRRGVYLNVQRTFMLPMLQAFDVADPTMTCARRDRSNTPLQALTLWNDPVFVEAARALGEWAAAETGSDSDRLAAAFRRCMGRRPEAAELAVLAEVLHLHRAEYSADRQAAAALRGDAPRSADAVPVHEVAAWISVARVLLNLDELITRE